MMRSLDNAASLVLAYDLIRNLPKPDMKLAAIEALAARAQFFLMIGAGYADFDTAV